MTEAELVIITVWRKKLEHVQEPSQRERQTEDALQLSHGQDWRGAANETHVEDVETGEARQRGIIMQYAHLHSVSGSPGGHEKQCFRCDSERR